jgi:hypothetical protein
MSGCQFIGIAEIKGEATIFKGFKAGIEVSNPDDAVAALDKVEDFIPSLADIAERYS